MGSAFVILRPQKGQKGKSPSSVGETESQAEQIIASVDSRKIQ
jgi:hypothetical protein